MFSYFAVKVSRERKNSASLPKVSVPSAYPWKHRALLEMRGLFHAQLQQQH